MDDPWNLAVKQWIDAPKGCTPDPKLFAGLLRSERPIPPVIRSMLAEALDPTQPLLRPNYRIVLKWTGSGDRNLQKGIKKMLIGSAVGERVRDGETVERASEHVAKENGIEPETAKKTYEKFNRGMKFFGMGIKRSK
jgi:hypothetical protein